ncbi:hypothetical protein DL765_005251 [Monosporascus sp. GIB2]|nr:hypothetical protein DL765_005251 [Monosporascus sp. GIB2]
MDSSAAVPIVRYGVENKNIPGDPTGWKMKGCGNICHWTGRDRYRSLSVEAVREHGTVVRDTPEELVIDRHFRGFDVRVIQLPDASYADKGSYTKARRARELEKRSEEKMTAAEPVMGRGVENLLTAQRMHRGEAPPIPMHRATKDNPDGNEDRGKWYKILRVESCRRLSGELRPITERIRREDNSPTRDEFREHQRDQGAAADEEIYETVSKDIVIILDKESNVLLCYSKRLFQFLFDEKSKNKLDDASRKWSSLPPLPVPETARHMVDDLIRQQHPELDLGKAQSLEELEQRYQSSRAAGGNICFPPLAMALDYLPGDCVIFRGAEMEHFVADWTGYRIFLLYTYHQRVRNYAHRIIGKLPPKPNDPWHPDRVRKQEEAGEATLAPESEPDIDSYDPCYTEPLSPEPETLYEADTRGPQGPEFKKPMAENWAHGLADGM